MPTPSCEHASLAVALLGVAFNVWVLIRIHLLRTRIRVVPLQAGETLQASGLLPLDLGVNAHTASGPSAAPGEAADVDVPKDVRIRDNSDASPGLHAVRELRLLDVVTDDRGSLFVRLPVVERDLSDRHRQISRVDDLDAPAPDINAGDIHRNVGRLESHGVLSDQPDSVEHAERGAKHRDS